QYLPQRSRPQLFSNALPPTVAGSALAAVRHLERHPELVQRLHENARYFRGQLAGLGFQPLPGETPIVPVILGETAKAIRMSELLLEEGVFVTGFGYPVVPQGHARVRCQLSAAHTQADLDFALQAFKRVGSRLGLIWPLAFRHLFGFWGARSCPAPQVLSRFRGLKRRGIAFSDRSPYFGGHFSDLARYRGVVP